MTTTIFKFQQLDVNSSYEVLQRSDLIKTKYGNTYILKVRNKQTNEEISIWPTKTIVKYMEKNKNKSFIFEVRIDEKKKKATKYAFIENYNPFNWTMLEG